MKNFAKIMAATAALLAIISGVPAYSQTSTSSTLDVISSDPELSEFRKLIKLANLNSVFASGRPQSDRTSNLPQQSVVFAPTNAAFQALPSSVISALAKNPIQLRSVLLGHISYSDLDTYRINQRMDSNFQNYLFQEFANNVVQRLTRFNGQFFVENNLITTFDIRTGTGIIHKINGVILPRDGKPILALANIYLTLRQDGKFKNLTAALESTGLSQDLSLDTSYTVFAPTDAAFALLPKSVLDKLLANPAALKELLLNHVSKTVRRNFADVIMRNGTDLRALGGELIKTYSTGEGNMGVASLHFNNAYSNEVIDASNGYIFVIDRVLDFSK